MKEKQKSFIETSYGLFIRDRDYDFYRIDSNSKFGVVVANLERGGVRVETKMIVSAVPITNYESCTILRNDYHKKIEIWGKSEDRDNAGRTLGLLERKTIAGGISCSSCDDH